MSRKLLTSFHICETMLSYYNVNKSILYCCDFDYQFVLNVTMDTDHLYITPYSNNWQHW